MDNKENADFPTKSISNSEKRAKIAMYNTTSSASNSEIQDNREDNSENNTEKSVEISESPIGAPIKKQLQLEMSKLQDMTFRKKVEYIWEYYRYHIIGIAIASFLLISMMVAIFSPSPDTVLFVSWSAGFATDEQVDNLTHELELLLTDDEKYEQVEVVFFITVEGDPLAESANLQRVVAMISTGHIDIFILNEQMLRDYSMGGFVQSLDSILAEVESINPNVSRKIEDRAFITYLETEPHEFSEQLTGISIGDSPLLTELNFFEQELFFAVSVTSGQIENVVKTLIEFFEPSNLSD
ncbi:MAG: hypothetical protein FWD05_02010 [Oscillospiraceae bacterium]|nr:hypothetical protein [Oscillospiraceae bacterium]